jgi:hypothetical protein
MSSNLTWLMDENSQQQTGIYFAKPRQILPIFAKALRFSLGVSGLFLLLGSSSVASAKHMRTKDLHCTVGNGYTFTYHINYEWKGQYITIKTIKMTDAAHGHYVARFSVMAYQNGVMVGWDPHLFLWPYGYTKAPRIGWTDNSLTRYTTGSSPIVLNLSMEGYTSHGDRTPVCHKTEKIWGG